MVLLMVGENMYCIYIVFVCIEFYAIFHQFVIDSDCHRHCQEASVLVSVIYKVIYLFSLEKYQNKFTARAFVYANSDTLLHIIF